MPIAAARDWRDGVDAALRAGARVITLYGRPDASGILVTAVLETSAGEMSVLRGRVDREIGYHSFTPELASLHCFERELHEQHGVRIAGHPWLKPVRFESCERSDRDAYPFYSIKGKEVHEVAVGPIHAGVIEPGSFRFMCLGEQVHHLEIHLGYQHRGVEKLLLAREPRALAPLVETIAGDSTIAHTWAYAAALESLAGLELANESELARGVMLELERIAMHLSTLAGMSADLGFLQGASTYGRLRTTAINTSMRLCGSRLGRGAIRPGGVRAKMEKRPDLAATADGVFSTMDLQRNVKLLVDDIAIMNDCFLSARTVQHRLHGAGVVTTELAGELGLVGVAARASGVRRDLRARGDGVYARALEPCIEPDGDCWARAVVRIREINRSLAWIAASIEACPSLAPARATVGPLAPESLVVSMTEGVRGEIVHALETDEQGGLRHYKVQDPSLRNWMGLALAVRENEISDFPICNKSFDLSYSGNDL
jgi:Ni,Fe-hydrogenase III large subunit